MENTNSPGKIGLILVLILIIARMIAFELNEIISMSRSDCDRIAFYFIVISTSIYLIRKHSLNIAPIIYTIIVIIVMLVSVDVRGGVAFLIGMGVLFTLPFIANTFFSKEKS